MKVEDFTSPDSGSGIFHFNSPNFTWRFWSLWSIVHAIQNLLGHPVQSGKLLELSFSFWSNSMIWPLTEKFVYKQKFAKLSLDSILRNNNTIWKVLTARGFFLRLQPSQNKKQQFCGFFSWNRSLSTFKQEGNHCIFPNFWILFQKITNVNKP